MTRPLFSRYLAAGLLAATLLAGRADAETYKMMGSPVVAHVMVAAAPVLRQQGIDIKVGIEGPSGTAAAMVGSRQSDFGLLMRPLTPADRARFPERDFKEFRIGVQAIALIVPRDVWESGVRAVSKAQVQGIYEGRIINWKELGGADMPIKFFNSERGRGVWELFATWIYGETRRAPLGKFPITVDGEDARNTVHFTKGSMALAQFNFIDRKEIFGLAIKDDDGTAIEATVENCVNDKYPLARPAMVVVGETPVGDKRKIIDFLLGEAGQKIVGESDLIPLKAFAQK